MNSFDWHEAGLTVGQVADRRDQECVMTLPASTPFEPVKDFAVLH
jgi:hypothetical protein